MIKYSRNKHLQKWKWEGHIPYGDGKRWVNGFPTRCREMGAGIEDDIEQERRATLTSITVG